MPDAHVEDTCPDFGSADLRLPDELRAPLRAHIAALRERYLDRGWGARVGFGSRPALVVIDMAKFWLQPDGQIGSDLTSVLDATCRVLESARSAEIPVFFTTFAYDPAEPPSPHDEKLQLRLGENPEPLFELDPRSGAASRRRSSYASAMRRPSRGRTSTRC